MNDEYDLIVAGGGVAGMTAALYGARSGLKTVVIEQEICGGLANDTHTVENFPSYKSIGGMELMEKVAEQMEENGVQLKDVTEITGFQLEGDKKTVITDEGPVSGRALILATGRKPVPLPVETDWDEHVHYCSICDGNLYKGKNIIVVGGGNSAFDESLYLAGIGINKITLVEFLEKCPAAEVTQQRAVDTGKIEVHTSTVIEKINNHGNTCVAEMKDRVTGECFSIEADGIFVFIGQKPATELFAGKLNLDSSGYIVADADMKTNIPGVYAAGDVVAKKYRQLTTAMADGTIAALGVHNYLC